MTVTNTGASRAVWDDVSQIRGAVTNIARSVADTGMREGAVALQYLGRHVIHPASQALVALVHQVGIRPLVSSITSGVHHEIQETVHAVRDVADLGAGAIHSALAAIDRVADRTLSPGAASVAKAAVRGIPAALVTTGMLVSTPNLLIRGALLCASAYATGLRNTGAGVGMGFAAAGVLHAAEGLVTGNIGPFIRGGIEAAYGARIFRGVGLLPSSRRDIEASVPQNVATLPSSSPKTS